MMCDRFFHQVYFGYSFEIWKRNNSPNCCHEKVNGSNCKRINCVLIEEENFNNNGIWMYLIYKESKPVVIAERFIRT